VIQNSKKKLKVNKLRTRIAPSPTGYFHIGTLRTAYLNYLAAKSTGGEFILRIDDTDSERSKEEYVDYIVKVMGDFNLKPDLVYRQSKRQLYYDQSLFKLLQDGVAKISDDKTIRVDQLVIVRSDGTPTYNFASVVDDIDMDINCIIRGSDHIPNLPFQQLLWRSLTDKPFPQIHHVGLLFEGGKKLSKRIGNGDIAAYEKYNKDAILNWVLRLGWSHKDPNFDQTHPIVTRDLALKLFWEGNLQPSQSSINIGKLNWYNKKYNNL
jgi:glutamyl-tRNA synthetase